MNTNRHPVPAAGRVVKTALLPLVTWPAHQVLRRTGYYRRRPDRRQGGATLLALYGGIGNVVLATPMLRAIHRDLPESGLHVWCQAAPAAEICRAVPYVDEVWVDGRDAVPSGYDLFVANCVAPPLRASLFGLRCGASVRAGEDATRSRRGLLFTGGGRGDSSAHEVRRNLNVLRAIGLDPSSDRPFVNLRREHRAAARGVFRASVPPGRPCVGLHPGCGAGEAFKRWGRSKFAELARRLSADHGAAVLLFGGPEEVELAEAIADESGCGRVVAGRGSLLAAAALIERCDLFVSNDSGLMHIAAAVGTPTVGIFGPTRPEKNRPHGTGHVVVSAAMPCQPCYTPEGRIGCGGPIPCLAAVSVEQVLSAAARLLSAAAARCA